MATYNPPPFPRRPKNANLLTETRYQFQLAYYRYEINTALYVMSPGEKLAYNIVVMSLLALLFSAVYYYLPKTTITGLQRLAYYITGSHRMHRLDVASAGVMQSSGAEAMASLGGMMNATALFAP
ncbi:hypothetical protein FE78DRAFT_32607 [Lecanosticta acicola]|uniref:Uncharacterized protein n=1 Tax=Lecanosticta acicola TaxID=111012 RepID=A0AAI8Z1G2_9PEZI|nr:hypothetical protein FE78DRAFT_32607 [Lecanosticta acicola]